MRDEPQNDLKPNIRQLPQAVNAFLKLAMPQFTLESCAEAFILTLGKFIPFQHLLGYLWHPAHKVNHRIRLSLEQGLVRQEKEIATEAPILQNENPAESLEDVRLRLHRSLKSLQSNPAARQTLENSGCRAAIEIHFTYYSKPILWIILGLSNARLLPPTKEFILVFCRCCLVSMHGAYLAELDEREGRREKPGLSERFSLTLQWFHSVVRHLNIAISHLENERANEAEDALQRASIVAGICLAEMLSLIGRIEPPRSLPEPPELRY